MPQYRMLLLIQDLGGGWGGGGGCILLKTFVNLNSLLSVKANPINGFAIYCFHEIIAFPYETSFISSSTYEFYQVYASPIKFQQLLCLCIKFKVCASIKCVYSIKMMELKLKRGTKSKYRVWRVNFRHSLVITNSLSFSNSLCFFHVKMLGHWDKMLHFLFIVKLYKTSNN